MLGPLEEFVQLDYVCCVCVCGGGGGWIVLALCSYTPQLLWAC